MKQTLTLICLAFCISLASAAAAPPTFNIRDAGAKGDGKTLDTPAINQSIAAASAVHGVVLFPPGQYLTGTIQLKSNVTLSLEPGCEIIGTPDLDQYAGFQPAPNTPLATRSRWHRGLILGDSVENVSIIGQGVINGNKVFDPRGEERMRGPHGILFGNSKNITLRDFSIKDAANYAIMLEFTSQVEARGLKITGGWDGIHFRGWKGNPCRNITITDCDLSTGDDCIAGWFWENTLIARCTINSSCNGIRLIGPAKNLIIHDCLFFGPGKNEHRTSRDKHRTNMLAGLCLQPGAWDKTEGILDDVKISNITMHDVTTPLLFSVKQGNTVGKVSIDRLTATGCYRAPASIECWADTPIEQVTLRDITLEFSSTGAPPNGKPDIKPPGVDARPLPVWALFARNIKRLELDNVRLQTTNPDEHRPAIIAQDINTLILDSVKAPRDPAPSALLSNVREVKSTDSNIALP